MLPIYVTCRQFISNFSISNLIIHFKTIHQSIINNDEDSFGVCQSSSVAIIYLGLQICAYNIRCLVDYCLKVIEAVCNILSI